MRCECRRLLHFGLFIPCLAGLAVTSSVKYLLLDQVLASLMHVSCCSFTCLIEGLAIRSASTSLAHSYNSDLQLFYQQ